MNTEDLSQVFAGLGALGMLAAVVLGTLLTLVIPWWAIFDVLRSKRDQNGKLVLIIVLVVTWGFGSLVYGLFLTRSWPLRLTTLFGGLATAGFAVFGVGSLMGGLSMASQVRQETEAAERAELEERFAAEVGKAEPIEGFQAVLMQAGSIGYEARSWVPFDLTGPTELSAAVPLDDGVRQAAMAGEQLVAITQHDVGRIQRETGEIVEIPTDDVEGFSWPKGLAASGDGAWVMTSHVHTQLYAWDPSGEQLNPVGKAHRDLPIVALAMGGELLYGLSWDQGRTLERIVVFNQQGAVVSELSLSPVIPLRDSNKRHFQLVHHDDRLIVLDHAEPGLQSYVVDPGTGGVSVP